VTARLTAARPTAWVAAWAAAYTGLHHLGALPDGLGSAPHGTRWVDWLDLLVPYLVLAPALVALSTAGTDRRGWWTALLGAGLYVQGHGVHLAANSIANVRGDAPPVHLWDEVLGHWIWYAGVALLVVAVARAVELPVTPLGGLLALGVGLTWTTNALEGTTAVGSLAVAAVLAVWGLRRGAGTGTLLVVAFGTSALLLAGYGLWQGGFPAPSEL
jgi:hypothetical protein